MNMYPEIPVGFDYISDVVFLNGEMTKIQTPEGQASEAIKFNFSFILKKEDGQLKIWQCRIAR